ncbi:hypothetical protein FZEAL_2527 [Fusarium zealandicum]|uniref:Uncharacterized protein n=1 Tax=Fusarium zealandicum TaxID=1053134 RepID=A0A8H4XNT3_9HYPO|nr:hypothetical protein FZEAL_2527 [Fusarium zealandicum]
MPALPELSPSHIAIGLQDRAASALFTRDFRVWVYDDDDDDYYHRDRRLSKEMIAVIVAAILVVAAIIAGIFYLVKRKRQSRSGHGYAHTSDSAPLMMGQPDTNPYNHNAGPQYPTVAYNSPEITAGYVAGAPQHDMAARQGPDQTPWGENPPTYNEAK